MASVNKVILVGNLGRDPETRFGASGAGVCTLAIATSYKKDKEQITEWHRAIAFGKLAEVCQEYLSKGDTVYIEGSLKTRQYEKDDVTHSITEIMVDKMQMLGARVKPEKREEAPPPPKKAQGKKPPRNAPDDDIPEDDIPY